MNLALVVFFAGCAGSTETHTSCPDSGGSGLTTDCADADAAETAAQAEVDAAVVARDRAVLALDNLVQMQVLALRAANEPASPAAVAAADLAFAARRAELAEAAVADPALDPTVLGLAGASARTSSDAMLAYLAVEEAIATVTAHVAALDLEVDTAVRAGEAALAAWPRCETELVAAAVAEVDVAAALDAARLANLAEASELLEVADAADAEVSDLLRVMRTTAVRGCSETRGDDARYLDIVRHKALADEVDRVAGTTSFNGHALSNGSAIAFAAVLGAESDEQIAITLGDLQATGLGVDTSTLDLSTATGACTAVAGIDTAQLTVEWYRGDLAAARTVLAFEAARLE